MTFAKLLAMASVLLHHHAFAQDANPQRISDASLAYECKQGAETRSVEVVTDQPNTKAPCRVEYTKAGSAPQALWSAANDGAYCEAKAKEFVAKLEGMGWTCTGR